MLLRLITSNVTFHSLKNACTLRNPSVVRQYLRNFVRENSTSTAKKTENLFLNRSITLGSGLGSSFLLRSYFATVSCQVNRTTDLRIASNPETKFDWRRFWKYLKNHIWKLLGAIVAALAVAYLNINIPSLLGQLVNALSKYAGTDSTGTAKDFNQVRISIAIAAFMNHDNLSIFQDVKGPASHLLLSYLAQSTLTFMYIFLLSQIGEQMACEIKRDLFEKILVQDISFFDENRTGELVNRLTTDVQEFKSSFKQTISQGLRAVAQLIGGSISLFIVSPQLATIALISVPTAVLFGSFLGKSLRDLSRRAQAQAEKATNVCQEALGNIRTVRSCAAENLELMFFEKEIHESARISQELGIGIAFFQALTNMFLNCMVLGTLLRLLLMN